MESKCESCSMAIITEYDLEIYNIIFKNTLEKRTHTFCMSMQQNIAVNITKCTHYMEKQ